MKPNTYCGVRLPHTIAFLDLRDNGVDRQGQRGYACDLVGELLHIKPTCPISLQWYYDAREASDKELANEIKHLRNIAAEYLKLYRHAKRKPAGKGEGGGLYYKPKAIYLTNYGGALVCDSNAAVVKGF